MGPTITSPATAEVAQPTPTASTTPSAMTPSAITSSRLSACTVAAAVDRIGVMRGATSMAPITTAEESASRPNAAIEADRTISAAKRAT